MVNCAKENKNAIFRLCVCPVAGGQGERWPRCAHLMHAIVVSQTDWLRGWVSALCACRYG
jgi:hypothetical protein